MGVDTSIYGQVRPFQMEDPMESAARAMQLRKAQREFTLENDVAAAGQQAGGDPEQMANLLMQRGHYAPAMQLRSTAATAEKEKRLAATADVDRKLRLAEAQGSDAMMLDATYRQALDGAKGDRRVAIMQVMPTYQNVRAKWAGMQVELPEVFDPEGNFAGIGQAKEAIQYLRTLQPEKEKKPASIQEYEYAKTQGFEGTFEQFQQNQRKAGATNVQVNTGPMGLTKTGANKVDEDLLGATRGLMQLDTIKGQFKPEYQRYMDKVGFSALKVKDSTVGLTNKEKTDLEGYSKYRRNAVNSLNEYIKSITGAAMSEAEAQRILNGMPKVGDGWFDGDSPTEFKAKLDDAMKQTKMAVARLSYIKRNGMSLEDGQGNAVVPLDRMPSIINARGKEIEAQLKAEQPKADAKALGRAVRRQLSVEFGLSSD